MSSQPKRNNPSWARIDTSLIRSPKVLKLVAEPHGKDALITYIDALLWSQQHLTDGGIPPYWQPATGRLNGQPAALCRVGLWVEVTDEHRALLPGDTTSPLAEFRWLIPGFHDYNKSRDDWIQEGARRSTRARKAANKRWGNDDE